MPEKQFAALQEVTRFSEKDVLLRHVTYMTKALEVNLHTRAHADTQTRKKRFRLQ